MVDVLSSHLVLLVPVYVCGIQLRKDGVHAGGQQKHHNLGWFKITGHNRNFGLSKTVIFMVQSYGTHNHNFGRSIEPSIIWTVH